MPNDTSPTLARQRRARARYLTAAIRSNRRVVKTP
eukprot:CAMPEP_0119408384 /NCGR_PEP_ID=MMETSP1335-20130426/1948_1 /TAXON_ID=259385 /ORGANISM="Chrysoculter rhomboideus, Strain RCC1486" /LENGTH=34 /DNA_ID= /DNA_START= /DNA_END= /DNA_ORIENTATION=